MAKKYHIHTFGCQMNVHDSEKISGIFSETGMKQADGLNSADVVVFNTCSIREKAEQKFFSELGRLKKAKKDNPNLKIAVAGCIAQQRGKELFKQFPYIDHIFGPNNIDNLPKWIDDSSVTDNGHRTTAIHDNPEYHNMLLPMKREGQVRAWVSIMYGCNNFCAYCVVPYTRGRERSRPSQDIYDEMLLIAEQGFKEVTLLGQNVNSYGNTLKNDVDFPGLLRKIHDIKGIERIRFVTSHPRDLSHTLIEVMSDLPKICNHIHLPVQSGSDRILGLMNRKYTYDEYKDKVDRLRKAIPDIAVTTDIIVGFPGETDDDFQCTLNALTEIEYDGIYAFKYSKRPGTKALELHGHIDEDIKSRRLAKVLSLQEDITYRRNKALEGQECHVLVEGSSETNSEKLTGRTTSNKIVNFYGDIMSVGDIVHVRIVTGRLHSLSGELIS